MMPSCQSTSSGQADIPSSNHGTGPPIQTETPTPKHNGHQCSHTRASLFGASSFLRPSPASWFRSSLVDLVNFHGVNSHINVLINGQQVRSSTCFYDFFRIKVNTNVLTQMVSPFSRVLLDYILLSNKVMSYLIDLSCDSVEYSGNRPFFSLQLSFMLPLSDFFASSQIYMFMFSLSDAWN